MKYFWLSVLHLIIITGPASAQQKEKQPAATKAADRLQGFTQRQKLTSESLLLNVPVRSVGPTIMSGRVVDVNVSLTDPTHFYVAYASGGLWKTQNNGISFTPVFDREAVMTIGDIAVDWQTETIWVGTGENNSSRSSYAGTGIYKSSDKGQSWQYLGLPESHHIGRIVLHPQNPQVAWVAALGHLYSPNPERGLYKTTDGGKTWQQTLFINENTGGIDLEIDVKDPNILYAATWERTRRAWDFVEGGAGSGIYKSTDGGNSWVKLSTPNSGFPTGEHVGRIGLALYPTNTNILYALVDNQGRRVADPNEANTDQLTRNQLRTLSKAEFLNISDQALTAFLEVNYFPKKYSANYIKTQVQRDLIKPAALVEYLEDANTLMYDRPVIGAEIYRSDDAGKTWRKSHLNYMDGMYHSFGYYFGQIRVAPQQPDKLYLLGVPLLKSEDGGKNFTALDAPNVHADHHALWVNANRPGHLVNGNDGGINISYDDGATWLKANSPEVGQFYSVAVDMEQPYNVYGGLQDNGVWYGPNTYRAGAAWHQEGNYPYKRLLGGDGMQVAVDTRDNATIYTGTQYGNYFRLNKKTGERLSIQPKHELGERPLRFNWQTPIHLSRHNQDVIYLGSHKFHRSLKKGEDMQTLSGDLTSGGRSGDVGYGTLTTIDESPLKFGLLYTGSDDGVIQVSEDGGNKWTCISDKLPQNRWVSRITASSFQKGRVYAALNGYRWDDFRPYLYVSEDYGKNWLPLGQNLPFEPINVVKEDPRNANILYVGTDHGVYLSLDQGKSFMRLAKDLPAVAVHDLVVHPRDNDLIIGTHGRSIYIASLEHVQQLTEFILQKPLHAFLIRNQTYSPDWGHKSYTWQKPLEPQIVIPYFLKNAGPVNLKITTENGLVLKTFSDTGEIGLNYAVYDLSVTDAEQEKYQRYLNEVRKKEVTEIKLMATDSGKQYLRPGKYLVALEAAGTRVTQDFVIQGLVPPAK
ncbi:WD40/YVTN/BNR-like repeat-containing protein [Adhaeribacter aerolatus]|nr:glycosyl hydrolase [Adhaeribacter aerolatus]